MAATQKTQQYKQKYKQSENNNQLSLSQQLTLCTGVWFDCPETVMKHISYRSISADVQVALVYRQQLIFIETFSDEAPRLR